MASKSSKAFGGGGTKMAGDKATTGKTRKSGSKQRS